MRQLFSMGFRPFFLFGPLAAIVSGCIWLFFFQGQSVPHGIDPIAWHAHEMLQGFAAAIIAGFLLTASANWTQTRGLHGPKLAFIVLAWLVGRFVYAWIWVHGPVALIWVSLTFHVALLLALSTCLVKAGKWRNIGLMIWILTLMIAEAMSCYGFLNGRSDLLNTANLLSLNSVLAFLIIIGGRVIPFFTKNQFPQHIIKPNPTAEKMSVLTVLALVICDLLLVRSPIYAHSIALLLGLILMVRMRYWRSLATISNPLICILHIGYAFIPFGLLMRGSTLFFDTVPRTAWVHILTVGAMSTLIIGMITRVTLGHTGRIIKNSTLVTWSFVLILLATLLRQLAAWMPQITWARDSSMVMFLSAFLIFLVGHFLILVGPRADGKPG